MATVKTFLGNIKGKDGVDGNPIGTIIAYMGISAPSQYLICDGTEYNITEYKELANLFENQFGSVSYFGGDGVTTFAVPDLRGEFLRGTGTATRDTGSGADVGVHQDPTKHINIIGYGSKENYLLQRYADNKTYNVLNKDNNDNVVSTMWHNYTPNSNGAGSGEEYYTSRPTNTSVLFCIKYI